MGKRDYKLINKEGLDYLTDIIRGDINTKVTMEEGKGLSSNDYTDAEKIKLEDLENAEELTIEEINNLLNF